MRNFLFLLIISLFVFYSESFSQTNQSEKDAVNAMIEQKNAWNRGDLTGYMDAYWNSDSLIFIGKNGPQCGWNTTYENYRKGFPDKAEMGNLEFTFLNIKSQSESIVTVIGKWELTIKEKKRGGYFTCILKIIDGKWKVIIDHTN